MMNFNYCKFLFSSLFIFVFSTSLLSQEIEEVVVTATKKEESLQDVAIAVEAFTSEDIVTQQIFDLSDIVESVPGMGVAKSVGSGSAYQIRGIASFGVGAANTSSVVTASNGHSVNDSVFVELGMYDLERIEVLKGPQGTLNGRNATTGVINFITARPTGETGGSIDVVAGNYDQLRTTIVLNTAFGDDVSARLAVVSNERSGYMDNLYTGTDYDDRQEESVRLSLDWLLNDTVTVKFTSQFNSADDSRPQEHLSFCTSDQFYGCSPFERGPGNSAADLRGHYDGAIGFFAHLYPGVIQNSYAGALVSDDPFRSTYLNRSPSHEQDTSFTTLELVKDFENFTFIAKYSYDTREFHQMNDNDGTVATAGFPGLAKLLDPTVPDVEGTISFLKFREFVDSARAYDFSDVLSNDQQFEINIISDFDGSFNYTVGLYTYDARNDNNYTVHTSAGGFLGNFGDHPYNALFQQLAGLPDLSAYGGLPFNIALAGTALLGFAPSAVCPLLGSWSVPLPSAGGAIVDVCALFGLSGPGFPAYNTPVEITGVLQDTNTRTLTYSAFGEFYFELDDVSKLTLGFRYDEQSIANSAVASLTDANSGNPPTSWLTGTGPSTGIYDRGDPANVGARYGVQEDEFLNYKAAYQRDISEDIMMYVSYATSTKPGGFNPGLASTSVPFQFDEEESETVDIGFRSTLANGAVRLNMNYYIDNRTGMQVGAIKDTSAINWNIDAEISGFEGSLVAFLSETLRLDFNWLISDSEVASGSDNIIDPLNPAAANGVLQYIGAIDANTRNAGLLTTAIMDNGVQVFKSAGFICLAPAAPLQNIPCTNDGIAQDISGNRIPGQQNESYNIALTKTFETGNGAVDIRLSRKYRGQMFMDIWNNERSDLPESSNGDLLVSFKPNNGDWYINGFIKNINDSRDLIYLRAGSNFQGGNVYGSITEPRTFGLMFGTSF
jgi:outer membrane receptor protein involved in Fe transport